MSVSRVFGKAMQEDGKITEKKCRSHRDRRTPAHSALDATRSILTLRAGRVKQPRREAPSRARPRAAADPHERHSLNVAVWRDRATTRSSGLRAHGRAKWVLPKRRTAVCHEKKRRTSNVQHRTSNTAPEVDVESSMFNVRRSFLEHS